MVVVGVAFDMKCKTCGAAVATTSSIGGTSIGEWFQEKVECGSGHTGVVSGVVGEESYWVRAGLVFQ